MGRTRSSEGGVDRKELLWVVTELCRTAKNSTLPVLRSILVETLAGGALTLRATDQDLHVSCATGWRLSNEFRVLVDANRLKTLLGSDGDVVSLSHIPGEGGFGELAVRMGGVVARLPSLDPDDFPLQPEATKEKVVARFRGDKIADALGLVVLAMSGDETRLNLNGVHLDGKRGRMESTDGHRCHMASVSEGMGEILKEAGVTVRDQAAKALHRVLKRSPCPVVISRFGGAGDPGTLITAGGWRMVSNTAAGRFPPTDQVDVDDSSLDVVMVGDGKKLTKALRQARKLAHENMIKLDLCGHGATALVGDPADGDLVEMALPLSAEKWDEPGLNMTAGFNVRYLLEAVQHADGDVRIGLARGDPKKEDGPDSKTVKSTEADLVPLVVIPRKGWRVLVMPMRL